MPWTVYNRYGQRKYLTSSEIDAFISSSRKRSIDVQTFCCMVALTGCRISEALEMTKDCIDFETKHVIIRCLKKRGKRVFRAIPLPAPFLAHLKKWFGAAMAPSQQLWPWSRMTGYRRICEVMESAGIRGTYASPKGLRHGFGVRAIQSGVPLTLVQRWLGHADIKTTAIYTTAMGPEEREIASRMWRHPSVDGGARKVIESSEEESSRDAGVIVISHSSQGTNADKNEVSAISENILDSRISIAGGEVREERRSHHWQSVKSLTQRLTACPMIHFWLKCRTYYRYDSKAYEPPGSKFGKQAPVADAAAARLMRRPQLGGGNYRSTSKLRTLLGKRRHSIIPSLRSGLGRMKAMFAGGS